MGSARAVKGIPVFDCRSPKLRKRRGEQHYSFKSRAIDNWIIRHPEEKIEEPIQDQYSHELVNLEDGILALIAKERIKAAAKKGMTWGELLEQERKEWE